MDPKLFNFKYTDRWWSRRKELSGPQVKRPIDEPEYTGGLKRTELQPKQVLVKYGDHSEFITVDFHHGMEFEQLLTQIIRRSTFRLSDTTVAFGIPVIATARYLYPGFHCPLFEPVDEDVIDAGLVIRAFPSDELNHLFVFSVLRELSALVRPYVVSTNRSPNSCPFNESWSTVFGNLWNDLPKLQEANDTLYKIGVGIDTISRETIGEELTMGDYIILHVITVPHRRHFFHFRELEYYQRWLGSVISETGPPREIRDSNGGFNVTQKARDQIMQMTIQSDWNKLSPVVVVDQQDPPSYSRRRTTEEWREVAEEMNREEFGRRDIVPVVPAAPRISVNMTIMNFIDLGITRFPPNIDQFHNLRVIDCSVSRLTSLPDSLGSLTSLQRLDCSRNSLIRLPNSLGGLTSLQWLECSFNRLISLPNSLGGLTSLLELVCSYNRLISLPESLGNLTYLQKLDCSDNPLTSLPNSLGGLTSLLELSCTNNRLTSLPNSLGGLTSLLELHCSYNQLISLPESLGNLTYLYYLDCSYNQLTSLPDSLGSLASLQQLICHQNQLISLPESLGSLTFLQWLSCSNNQLISLPDSLGSLTSLQSLYCSNNRLTSLPESLGRLTSLLELLCSYNQLISLPESLGSLTYLQKLYCSDNPLTSLPIGLLRNVNLEIDIDHTPIERQYGSLLAYKQHMLGTARSKLPASARRSDHFIIF